MKRAGLFVGIDNYNDRGICRLNCAYNDAFGLCNQFAYEQFDIVELLANQDAGSVNIIDKVDEITGKLSSGDLFVFYFAGHGREFNQEHYLVGHNGKSVDSLYRHDTVTVTDLLAASDKRGVKRLFILDCCRSNLIGERGESYRCPESRDIYLRAAITEKQEVDSLQPLIISSCSTGQQAFELEKHGVFTQALLNILKAGRDIPVTDFSGLLKQLNAKIKMLIPEGKNQTISLAGNAVEWNDVPLFKRWEDEWNEVGKLEPEDLNDRERGKYYLLREEIESLLKNLQQTERFPETVRKMMVNAKNACTAVNKSNLQVLQKARESFTIYTDCQKVQVQAGKLFAVLHQHKAEITADLQRLQNTAENAVRQEDFSVGFSIYSKLVKQLEELNQIYTEFDSVIFRDEAKGIKFSSDKRKLLKAPEDLTGEYSIPHGVTGVETEAFAGCVNLTSVEVPCSVCVIGEGAFAGCRAVKIADGNEFFITGKGGELIGKNNKMLIWFPPDFCGSYTVPDAVTSIGAMAFADCAKLAEINITDSVTSVRKFAFKGCSNLVDVKISESVQHIADSAFSGTPFEVNRRKQSEEKYGNTVMMIAGAVAGGLWTACMAVVYKENIAVWWFIGALCGAAAVWVYMKRGIKLAVCVAGGMLGGIWCGIWGGIIGMIIGGLIGTVIGCAFCLRFVKGR